MNRDMERDPFEAEDQELKAGDDEWGEEDAPDEPQDIEKGAESQKTKKRGWAISLVGFLILISFIAGAMGFRENEASDLQKKISPDAEMTNVISLAAPKPAPKLYEVKPQPQKPTQRTPPKPTKSVNKKRQEITRAASIRLPEPSKEELLGKSGKKKSEELKEISPEPPKTAKPSLKEKPKEANTKKDLEKNKSDAEKERLVNKEFELRLAINELLSRK